MKKIDHVFDQWNNVKKRLSKKYQHEVYINERDIWYVKLGINIGREQDGQEHFRRPVLVVKIIGSVFLTVPLTSNINHLRTKNSIFYHKIHSALHIKESLCILSQIRVLDKSRFISHIDYISINESIIIKQKIRELCL